MLSLNDLLIAYAASSDRHGSYARALETLIGEREQELRLHIENLTAGVAMLENWTDEQRRIASRFADICPAGDLERLCVHFGDRLEWARWCKQGHRG